MSGPAPDLSAAETPADFGPDRGAVARRWLSEIELAEKTQAPWRERCRRIIERYAEDRGETSSDAKARRFSLLWANDWTSASGIGYVGAARMQVNLIGDTSTPVLDAGTIPDANLGVDSAGDTLFIQSGLPFDVPCQLLGFDIVYEAGGQL